jgi:hypothetical protein
MSSNLRNLRNLRFQKFSTHRHHAIAGEYCSDGGLFAGFEKKESADYADFAD